MPTTDTEVIAVTAGPFAVLDKDGNALCHGARQDKRSLNNGRRNIVKDEWKAALILAGLATATHAVLADGPVGMPTAPFGAGVETRDGFADFGHVYADANDGAYCGCNAVPVEGKTNRNNKDGRQAICWSPAQQAAYGQAFRLLALARMTGTKRRRAV